MTLTNRPEYLESLSRFAAGTRWSDIGPDVRTRVGWILADTVAAIVGGASEPELEALSARQVALPDGTSGGATLIGSGRRVGADTAALINGAAGTFLEMDEGNRFARGHPAVHVIPALIALAERDGADAADFLAAIVTGYEVGSRLGSAARLRGAMHPHGTWGTIAAGAACGRLAGLDSEAMREVINIGASLTTATSKRTMLEGGLVRNVYAGLANRGGLLALELAQSGFTGERDGPGTLFGAIVSEHFDTSELLAGIGYDWHLMRNYFKLHACCRYNHGALDALDLIDARGEMPAAGRIASVRVESYNLAAELNDREPGNTLAGKFSVPFAVATRIVNASSALPSFTWDAVRDPAVRALALKVSVSEDPAMTRRLPLERPARVTIVCDDGREIVAEVGVNRGDDASPYTPDELRGKFMMLVERMWPEAHGRTLLDSTLSLAETGQGLAQWLALLKFREGQ